MVSAAGSGEVLFTPRVGARYQYTLLWAAVVVSLFMWVMVREVGRYTIVAGTSILDGYASLPGPRRWALWFIFVPQLVAGVVTVAGMTALVGSALMIALPGSQLLYAVIAILVAAALVVLGQYSRVETAATVMAAVLVAAAVVTAIRVFPAREAFFAGLVPTIPANFDLYFVLPWVGFLHAGAAGLMWYSYWTRARGYARGTAEPPPTGDEPRHERSPLRIGASAGESSDETDQVAELASWHRLMATAAAIGVTGGLLIIGSFLVLGSELLAPQQVVPAGIDVAADLTLLLSEVWGSFGYWLLLVTVVIALWGTIVANLDGWGRTYVDASRLLFGLGSTAADSAAGSGDRRLPDAVAAIVSSRERLRRVYVITVLTALPIMVIFLVRDPVGILSVGGIIAAAHTPIIVFLTLWLNLGRLPRELRPNWLSTGAMIVSGGFFAIFALLYLLDMAGIRLL